MASHSHAMSQSPRTLPDLPPGLFGDDEEVYAAPPRRRAQRGDVPRTLSGEHARPAHRSNRRGMASVDPPAQDRVTATVMPVEPAPSRASRSRELTWAPPVMPRPIEMAQQGFPNLLMAASILVVFLLGTFTPLGIPVWAAGIFVPSVLLALVSASSVHRPLHQASLVNIAMMAIVFPVLVIRQSVVRVPFVDGGNGTLLPPVIATVAVVVLLAALAISCAVLSQEDPEYSGVIFLPAAMMVPLLAGQSDLVSVSSALLIAIAIFFVSAVLTVLASILPAAVSWLITPTTIAVEFIVLTVFRSSSIFPTGAGNAAKLLFFAIVVSTVALAILVPMMSVWVRQVTRLAKSQAPG